VNGGRCRLKTQPSDAFRTDGGYLQLGTCPEGSVHSTAIAVPVWKHLDTTKNLSEHGRVGHAPSQKWTQPHSWWGYFSTKRP